MNFNRIRLCLNPKHDSSTEYFFVAALAKSNDVAKSQRRFQQVLNLCYVKIPNFSIMGLTDILLSFATVLQPPNVFRFSSQLCLNGRQLLRSENRFFFIFILKHHYTAPTTFSLFSNKHCLFHIFYDHASNTCHMCTPYVHASYHMPYCKVPLCELQLVMLKYCYKDAYYSTL